MFSVATLTGHAVQSWGPYTAVVENGPAREVDLARSLQTAGDVWGDPLEVSSYRKEDVLSPTDVTHDVVQHMSGKPRGHQFAAGFLMIASGLSNHGRCGKIKDVLTHKGTLSNQYLMLTWTLPQVLLRTATTLTVNPLAAQLPASLLNSFSSRVLINGLLPLCHSVQRNYVFLFRSLPHCPR